MEPVPSLRELFASLSGGSTGEGHDPAAILAAGGHEGLPDHLVAEAIGNYADTAPIEVAEHLSGYVMAHSPVPGLDPQDWHGGDGLTLLASAPDPVLLHDAPGDPSSSVVDHDVVHDLHLHDGDVGHGGPADLDFGHGHDVDDLDRHATGFEQHDASGTVQIHDDVHAALWTEPDVDQPVHEPSDMADEEQHHHDWDDHQDAHALDLPTHDGGDTFHPGV